jgi:hypothetical protein
LLRIPELPVEAKYVAVVLLLAWLAAMLYTNYKAGVRWSSYWTGREKR